MKRLLVLLCLLVSCASSTPKVADVPKQPSCADAKIGESCIPSPAVSTQTVRGQDWNINIPSLDWTERKVATNDPNISGVMYANEKQKIVLSVAREIFDPKLKIDAGSYTLRLAQRLEADGGKIDGITNTQINGKQFIVLEAHKSLIKLHAWVFVQHDVSYAFVCGGFSLDRQTDFTCTKIAEQFHIDD